MAAPPLPTVTVTIVDNGANTSLAVPLASIQLIIGCAIGGGTTSSTIVATTQAASLQSTLIGGPVVEAGGIVCQAGGTALVATCPIVTKGTATAVIPTVPGGSSSTMTVTLDGTNGAWDAYNVMVKCVLGGTIATGPITILISLDAGRNWSAPISLGTANTYVVGAAYSPATAGATGITLNFGAGTMVAGDYWRFSTIAPIWNDAGVQAAYNAYLQSQYSVSGVGSIHIVGVAGASDITNFQTYLQAGVAGFIFPRAIVELRDALTPTAWGGSGETEATWMAALATVTSGLTAQPRVAPDGPYYNTPSPYPNVGGGTFSYRRPLAWSHAARRTQIGLATRAGAVIGGAYSTIAVNAATDPGDGFIYHNELYNPGLNAARIGSAQTWPKQGSGFFQVQEPLLSGLSSQFTEMVLGNVVDAASDIAYATGVQWVSSSLTVQKNGTLTPLALGNLQGKLQDALQQGLVNMGLCSSVIALVSATANVLSTGNIPITITVTPFGYANSITFTINLNTSGIS